MNPHTLSAHAQRALESARGRGAPPGARCHRSRAHRAGPARGDGRPRPILTRLGLEPARCRERLEASGRRGRARGGSEELAYTSHAKRLIEVASKEARESGTGLSAEHLLLAALQEPRGTMAKILSEAGVPPARAEARDP